MAGLGEWDEMMSAGEIAGTLEAIRRRVRARQGLVPGGADEASSEARGALSEAMDAAQISAHFPILWNTPIIGRGLAYSKRVVRLLLRWYINPIVDQQNDFNAAVMRVLSELSAEQQRLLVRLEELQAALAERADDDGAGR